LVVQRNNQFSTLIQRCCACWVSEKIFKNRPIRNKNCLWRPCLLTDRNEMSNRNRWLSINASYQVPVHLAKRFQRRRIFKTSQSERRIARDGHVC